jgi:CRP-like cAMP-binding protein
LPRDHHAEHTLADTRLARLAFVSDRERAALGRVWVTPRYLAAGDELVREGSSPDHLYLLSEGWAYRYMTTRSGARQIPTLLVPGGVCNLDNLLLERADFGVRAITRATVLALPRVQALVLAAEHPGVGRAFTWLAIAENAILSQWALGLGRRSSQGRLAHLLCELSIRVGANDAGESSFELPLTQELIADVLGLTSVHVNRTMQQLRAEGLISTAGRRVTIPDMDRLRALAEFDASYLRQIEQSAAVPLVGAS